MRAVVYKFLFKTYILIMIHSSLQKTGNRNKTQNLSNQDTKFKRYYI